MPNSNRRPRSHPVLFHSLSEVIVTFATGWDARGRSLGRGAGFRGGTFLGEARRGLSEVSRGTHTGHVIRVSYHGSVLICHRCENEDCLCWVKLERRGIDICIRVGMEVKCVRSPSTCHCTPQHEPSTLSHELGKISAGMSGGYKGEDVYSADHDCHVLKDPKVI